MCAITCWVGWNRLPIVLIGVFILNSTAGRNLNLNLNFQVDVPENTNTSMVPSGRSIAADDVGDNSSIIGRM